MFRTCNQTDAGDQANCHRVSAQKQYKRDYMGLLKMDIKQAHPDLQLPTRLIPMKGMEVRICTRGEKQGMSRADTREVERKDKANTVAMIGSMNTMRTYSSGDRAIKEYSVAGRGVDGSPTPQGAGKNNSGYLSGRRGEFCKKED